MSTATDQSRGSLNQIISALPNRARARLDSQLERVTLQAKQILFDYDQPVEYVYFPETCVASVVAIMSDGSAVETATIGNEGMVGLPVFHGTDRTAAQCFAQVPGDALRMSAEEFRAELTRETALATVLNRYTQALFVLVAQSSACNRLHSARQRCARWLLMTQDRVASDVFPLTHQFLSQMLGVRRATVTEAAGSLQHDGLINYSYGQITVVDRTGLEAASCECYAVIRSEFARLLRQRAYPNPVARLRLSKDGKSTAAEPTEGVETEG